MSLIPFLHEVAARRDLNAADAQAAMETILRGESSQVQIAAFLTALRMKGESVGELVGFARAMREAALQVETLGLQRDHFRQARPLCGHAPLGSSSPAAPADRATFPAVPSR